MARTKTTTREPRIADTMYNMHQSSGASDDYRKGLIVGVIGVLMGGCGLTFAQAVRVACFHAPDAGMRMAVPDGWLVPFGSEMTALGKTYILPV